MLVLCLVLGHVWTKLRTGRSWKQFFLIYLLSFSAKLIWTLDQFHFPSHCNAFPDVNRWMQEKKQREKEGLEYYCRLTGALIGKNNLPFLSFRWYVMFAFYKASLFTSIGGPEHCSLVLKADPLKFFPKACGLLKWIWVSWAVYLVFLKLWQNW